MKALILAGGRGKRLNELSANHNKCMTKVGGRPVIEYNLDNAAATNLEEIIIVVGYRAEEIINAYGNRYKGKVIRYVIQWEQKGLVDAVQCAREAVGGQEFMLMLSDEVLVNPRHRAMIEEFRKGDCLVLCGVLNVEDKDMIRRTYTLIQDEDRNVFRLVEKPRHPLNDLMGTGVCCFKNEIYNYIDFTPIHHERKEKELPDLIQCVIDEGKKVKTFHVCERYTNINSPEDITAAEKLLKQK
ncbi:MAG: nucleotidyltransferase family protein [Candidatus Aminicenantes bacterium]|nr:nucleotidyltransferase family protein [Candidatus Aminicenantes bacterium]